MSALTAEKASSTLIAGLRCARRPQCRMLGTKWVQEPAGAVNWPAEVPRLIHISCGPGDCNQLESAPARALQWWRALNPGFEVVVHNETSCLAFLASAYNASLVATYRSIPQWAHRVRSDLWRLAFLLRHGGVYADADIEPVVALTAMMEPGDRFVTSRSLVQNMINPHFVIAAPGEPLLLETLRELLSRNTTIASLSRYGSSELHPDTGHRAMLAYNRVTICNAMHAVLTRRRTSLARLAAGRDRPDSEGGPKEAIVARGIPSRSNGGFSLLNGEKLLAETRVLASRCERCVIFGDRNSTAASGGMVRKATVDNSGNVSRILMFNKYASGPDGLWRYSAETRRLRRQLCPDLCL